MRDKSSTTASNDGELRDAKQVRTAEGSAKRLPAHDVVGALYVEHRYVARLLDVLEAQVAAVSRGQSLDREASLGVMSYMTQHPDAYHHPREDAMFARLAKRDPRLAKRIAEIQRAHATIGTAGRQLLTGLEQLSRDSRADDGVASGIGDYVSAMREHMAIEERDLFPRAREVLDDHDLAEVDQAFRRVIDPIFEASVRDAYAAYSPVVRYLAEQPAVRQAVGVLDKFLESALTLEESLFGAAPGGAPSARKPTDNVPHDESTGGTWTTPTKAKRHSPESS